METVTSKRKKRSNHKTLIKASNLEYPMRNLTLEDVLKEPFTRKKYEQAMARMAKSPVPEKLLQLINNGHPIK